MIITNKKDEKIETFKETHKMKFFEMKLKTVKESRNFLKLRCS